MPVLNWIGKEKVVTHHSKVPFHTLNLVYGYTADRGSEEGLSSESGNMIIFGDNLLSLKALLPRLEGRVKCIYNDPPYNTGEKWTYADDCNDPRTREWINKVVGKQGEDLSRHDKWLCMMYPRLVLMRRMLRPDGVIFISCDDNEQASLRLMMNEIFGEDCFVSNIIWQKVYSPRNDSKGIPVATDHIVAYSRKPNWNPFKLERTEGMNARYGNPDNDVDYWTSDNPFAPNALTHQGMVYAIQHPFSGEMIYPVTSNCWRYEQKDMLDIMNGWSEYELRDLNDAEQRAKVCGISADEVREGVMGIVLKQDVETSRQKARAVYERGQWPKFFFTNGGKGGIRKKTYLGNVEGRLTTNLWPFTEVDSTDGAKKELKEIFEGAIPFDTPKPTRLIDRILDIAVEPGDIVMDCFGGSGTTAHSVLKANQKDGGDRKFIVLEQDEEIVKTTQKRVQKAISGYKFTGAKTERLYELKLTAQSLKRIADSYADALKVFQEAKASGEYMEVKQPTVKDSYLIVEAKKYYDGYRDGLGGSFDMMELGEPLFIEGTHYLNEEVGETELRRYVYYTETHLPLTQMRSEEYPYWLDDFHGTGYYFYYEPNQMTTLSRETLYILKGRMENGIVVYADICEFAEEELQQMGITFRQIPRDIRKF
ncbi:MAG: site-specific DNA-methyltransferase [Prevotella sp.]|nr:site-specific DNA-methyltransferase [Prevotella sp.]